MLGGGVQAGWTEGGQGQDGFDLWDLPSLEALACPLPCSCPAFELGERGVEGTCCKRQGIGSRRTYLKSCGLSGVVFCSKGEN